MSPIPQRATGVVVALLAASILFFGSAVGAILSVLWRDSRRGCLPVCHGSSWLSAAVVSVAAASFVWKVWDTFVLYSVDVGPQGIRVRGARGWEAIEWGWITGIGYAGQVIVLVAGRRKIRIPLRAYRDAEALAAYIAEQVDVARDAVGAGNAT